MLLAKTAGPFNHVIVGSGNGWRRSRPTVFALVGNRGSCTRLMLRSLPTNVLFHRETLLVLLILMPNPRLFVTMLFANTALAEISSDVPCPELPRISLPTTVIA